MELKTTVPTPTNRIRYLRNYFLYPAVTVSSIFVQTGIKYFGNLTAIREILQVSEHDSTAKTLASVLTAGSVILQFTVIPYFVWKVMSIPETKNTLIIDSPYYSIQPNASININESDESQPVEEAKCQRITNDYCACSRRCLGAYLSTSLKFFSIIIIVPTIIIGGYLGLQTMFASSLSLSIKSFLQTDSDIANFYKILCFALPLISTGQYFSYNLVEGAFKNINKINKAIAHNQSNLACKMVFFTLLISIPCVLTSGPSTYYLTKTGIPNMEGINYLFDDSNDLLGIAYAFAAMMLPAQAAMFVPGLYRLLCNLSQEGSKAIIDTSHSGGNLRTLFLGSNILSIIFDAFSNFLLIRLSFKCMVHDFDYTPPTSDSSVPSNTTDLVSCNTNNIVGGLADVAAFSTALLVLIFNLIQLKRLMYETHKPEESPSQDIPLIQTPSLYSAPQDPFLNHIDSSAGLEDDSSSSSLRLS